ncbi:hypothetical protein SAMN02745146_3269 [Hymenobacter daecheongensis DSM 21074]|uniref:Uncharacterized protein n=1 Tax=Hymenobacter daecheongensis DSM 21074 TaxID=1121955 RepID=A0A1M6JU71_9BACT|nr:hypothetical protein [Hymenobacter daecheongensis]SHJ50247.1 hypothetical protein SAMN02745146_3269 [Hymenobacter daecheongensis DSM 21074]
MSAPASVATSSATTKTTITALNSTVIYLLAYLLINGLHQLSTVAMAVRLSIPGVWGVSSIKFSISDPEWWRTAVLAVYGVGPAVCAVVAIGAGLWFWKRERGKRGLRKLLLVWVAFHACNQVLGAMVGDTFTESGVWYVPSWLFLAGNTPNVVVAVLCGLLQMVVGYVAAVGFLQTHDSITLMQYPNRRKLIVATILIPWMAGSALLALLKYPDLSLNERLHFLTMGLLLLPLSLACANELFEFTVEFPQKTKTAWGLLALTGAVALGWWLLLATGRHF